MNKEILYRGEHGNLPDLTTRHGSLTFCDLYDAALRYATIPNHRDDEPVNSRVITAEVTLLNPFVNTPDSPFIDLSEIAQKLGYDEAHRIARKFGSAIEYMSQWRDRINGTNQYVSLEEFLDTSRESVNELYFDTYLFFDDKEEMAKLKTLGYDGGIMLGMGESMNAIEYRVIDPSSVRIIVVQQF